MIIVMSTFGLLAFETVVEAGSRDVDPSDVRSVRRTSYAPTLTSVDHLPMDLSHVTVADA